MSHEKSPGSGLAVAGFLTLSLVAVVVPLAEAWSALSREDLLQVAIAVSVLLGMQTLVLRVAAFLLGGGHPARIAMHTCMTVFLCLNVAFFFATVVNMGKVAFAVMLVVLASVYWTSFHLPRVRRFLIVFGCLFVGISLVKASYQMVVSSSQSGAAASPDAKGIARRNVYVMSVDSMVSREALRRIYKIDDYPHVAALEALGFRVSDSVSAGDGTLSTIGRMFMLGGEFQTRITKSVFNGIRTVPLYEALRRHGYRIQFVFESDIFGTDAGRIDYFYPAGARASLCGFIDQRYGIFVCRAWFMRLLSEVFGLKIVGNAVQDPMGREVEFSRILARFGEVSAGLPKNWFSFAHFNFPGHTPMGFRYDDLEGRRAYVTLVQRSLPEIAAYLTRAVQEIRARDRNAIIVFLGDHGGWTTRRATAGDVVAGEVLSEELIRLDRRGILLAVYPKDFCVEPMRRRPDSSLLFFDILGCQFSDPTAP